MCFVLESWTKILKILITFVLSHLIKIRVHNKPKSLKVCFIQWIYAQNNLTKIYLAFVMDSAIEFFFLLCHETWEYPKKWHVLLVLFLLTLQLAKSTLEKTIKSKSSHFGHHKPKSIVLFKYHKICLWYILRWGFLRHYWNLEHTYTLNMISSLRTVSTVKNLLCLYT